MDDESRRSFETLWLAPRWSDPADMLSWLPNDEEEDSQRKLRLFAVACCRGIWHLLDGLSRNAVEVAEKFADGRATAEQLQMVNLAAGAACQMAESGPTVPAEGGRDRFISKAHDLAERLPWLAELITQETFFRYMAQDASDSVASIVACSAVDEELWNTPEMVDACFEKMVPAQNAKHCQILRELFGNPFRPVAVDPSWLTTTVLGLAQGVYEERTFERLPILADALEEAGCTNADILSHCRQPGEHVRGCWVVDLLLGKQ